MTEATGDNGAAAAAAATAAATAATAAAAAAPAWFTGADPALIGHLQSHGWDKKTPTEVALAAAQSHQNAAKLLGQPPDKVARIPEPNDVAGWKSFYERLGAPTDAAKYDFTTVKNPDGTPLDPKLVDFYRAQAASLHLTPNAALSMVQAEVKRITDAATDAKAVATSTAQEERAAVLKDWGPNVEANLFVIRQTAAALGVDKATIDAFEKMEGVGYGKVMNMFLNIGGKMGEDTFVRNTSPGGAGVMSQTQALSRKQELMSDTAWLARYQGGDKVALKEMLALQTIILTK